MERRLLVLSASLRILARRETPACSTCSRLRSRFGSDFVVGHLLDEPRDAFAELIREHGARHLLILDRIVQQRRGDKFGIGTTGRLGDERRDLQQMIDVGLLPRALAALIDMPPRRRVGGAQDGNPGSGHGDLSFGVGVNHWHERSLVLACGTAGVPPQS